MRSPQQRPRKRDALEHDDRCAVCKEDGELQLCHNCPRAFHPSCLHPPIKSPPRGAWYCPKCQKKVSSTAMRSPQQRPRKRDAVTSAFRY
uniref:PHD-type domain-containing protein n=1 Tax=Poecilia latipinna TaxID=48699 RepID=A0A3B3TV39_9TELE